MLAHLVNGSLEEVVQQEARLGQGAGADNHRGVRGVQLLLDRGWGGGKEPASPGLPHRPGAPPASLPGPKGTLVSSSCTMVAWQSPMLSLM